MPVLPSHQVDESPQTGTEAGTTAGKWPPKDGQLRNPDCEARKPDAAPSGGAATGEQGRDETD